MFPCFDIFKLEPKGRVLWQGFGESVAAARASVQKLVLACPSDYLILNQTTGHRILVSLNHPVQPSLTGVESGNATG